jgi:phosphate transport system substrate-binding protein
LQGPGGDAFLLTVKEADGAIAIWNLSGEKIKEFAGELQNGYYSNNPYSLETYEKFAFLYRDANGRYHFIGYDLNEYFWLDCETLDISWRSSADATVFGVDGEAYTLFEGEAPAPLEVEPQEMVKVEIPPFLAPPETALFLREGVGRKSVNGDFSLLESQYSERQTVPVVENGRVLVPVRLAAEAFGARVRWQETQTATIHAFGKTVNFTIGSPEFFATQWAEDAGLTTESAALEAPARIIGDRMFVPLRALSEALGLAVFWDEETSLIGVNTWRRIPTETQLADALAGFDAGFVSLEELRRLDASTATHPCIDYLSAKMLGVAPFMDSDYNRYSSTIPAYDALIDGEKDLLLVTEPSPEILAKAAARGVEFEIYPFAKEGFVFLANAQNPVEGLTVAQLQDVYQGKITNWNEVGGSDLEIIPYQRNANSGSQTIMENAFMKGLQMADAPTRKVESMSGLIDVVAEFKESVNGALGYSVYYYAREMANNPNARFLALNGVAPSAETVRDGSYPAIVNYYLVKRKADDSEATKKILAYILSAEGQKAVEESGLIAENPPPAAAG